MLDFIVRSILDGLFSTPQVAITWIAGAVISALIAMRLFRSREKLAAFLIPTIWMIGYGGYNFARYGGDGQFGIFIFLLFITSMAASILAVLLVVIWRRFASRRG